MGFFRRLFKKTDKRRGKLQQQVQAENREARSDAENEAETARVLRTASSRYAVAHEINASRPVPPIPHPINNIVTPNHTGATTLTVPGDGPRRSYTVVKLYPRTRHVVAEHGAPSPSSSPNLSMRARASTFSGVPTTPGLLGLRHDPSVASLLSMYDDQGRLGDDAFANTPPRSTTPMMKERSETPPLVPGRAQTKRTASTLRQLMDGNPERKRNSVESVNFGEGDISWAERFLGENGTEEDDEESEESSPSSSSILQTPSDAFFHDQDLSKNSQEYMINDKLISSLEVELSNTSTTSTVQETHAANILDEMGRSNSPYITHPGTPQKASEVFGFLTARGRRQCQLEEEENHPLPSLPVTSTFSDDSHDREPENLSSAFSDDSSQPHLNLASTLSDDSHRQPQASSSTFSGGSMSPPRRLAESIDLSTELEAFARDLLNSGSWDDCHSHQPAESRPPSLFQTVVERNSSMHGPRPAGSVRGPRMISPAKRMPPSKRIPSGSRSSPNKFKSRLHSPPKRARMNNENRGVELAGPLSPNTRNALAERSNSHGGRRSTTPDGEQPPKDTFTAMPTRKAHTRGQMSITSLTSTQSLAGRGDIGVIPGKAGMWANPPTEVPEEKQSKRKADLNEAGNAEPFSFRYQLPMTPVHSRSLFRVAGPVPSPASSTDLSPVAKDIMSDLRQKRMQGRQRMAGDKSRAVPRMGAMF